MFNMKKHNKVAQNAHEVYLREENLGPKADDGAPISEKTLTHRTGYDQTTTEDQMKSEHEWSDSKEAQIVEKVLESADSPYVTHRNDSAALTVPPINALVETIRKKRIAEEYTPKKESHWSVSFNDKKQNGSLPKWNKNAPQHDKMALGDDPDRITGSNTDPATFHKETVRPLIGDITTADINRVAFGVKTGESMEYDTAIMAILRLAHDERRELTKVEQKTVVNLKTARTKKLLIKC